MTDEPNAAAEPAKLTAAERMAKARAARGVKTTTAAATPPVEAELADRAAAQREVAEAAATPVPTDPGLTNNARVANKLADEAALRARAARQRVEQGPEVVSKMVQVRITKRGDGKVSMGQHVAGVGEAYYEWKEEPSFPEDVAKALEDRDFVEIL